MSKILKIYSQWFNAYDILENLVRSMAERTLTDLDALVDSGYSETEALGLMIEDGDEDYSTIAYQDSIHLRFKKYYKLTIQLLAKYAEEKYSFSTVNPETLLEFYNNKKLLSSEDLSCLKTLTASSRITKSTQRIIEYTYLLNSMILQFNFISAKAYEQSANQSLD